MPDHDFPPEPTAVAPAAAAGLLDPFRATGDLEIDIPLRCIEPAPFNPKSPIVGPYRKGLAGSLGEFGLRDRLKVWPRPGSTGQYLALDGNQRLDVLREMGEARLVDAEVQRRVQVAATEADATADPDATELKPRAQAVLNARRLLEAKSAVHDDLAFMADVRARVATTPVPCRVLADLDRADAELFTATFDRNHAKFDELKQAELVDRSLAAKERLEGMREDARKRREAMTRPERPFVAPATVALPPPAPVAPPITAPDDPGELALPPAVDADGDDMPWGEPPAPVVEVLPTQAVPARVPEPPLVPVMFSLTQQSHHELTNGVLVSTQRLVRSTRLLEAVRKFTACSTEADLSEAAVEIALVCLQRRINVAEQDAVLT